MVIDARGRVNGETFPDNSLDDRVSLFEHKTLACLKVTVEARANLVRNDLKKRAEDLDARHPGSTFVQELASYGKYFVLVSGPFANLSRDFNPLVDLIARERSLQTIEFRDFRPNVILSMQKRALMRRRASLPLPEELRHEMQHVFDFGIKNCQTHRSIIL